MVVVERFGDERSRGRRGLEVRNEDEDWCGSGRPEYEGWGTFLLPTPKRRREARRLSRYEQISDGQGKNPCRNAALAILGVFSSRIRSS